MLFTESTILNSFGLVLIKAIKHTLKILDTSNHKKLIADEEMTNSQGIVYLSQQYSVSDIEI